MRIKKMYIPIIIILLFVLTVIIYMNLPKFGRLPQGERLKRIESSHNYRDGEFRNLSITPQLISDDSKLKTMLNFLFEKREHNRPEHPIPAIKSDLKNLPIDNNVIVWFGHSSYYIQLDGTRFLVDPVFYDASPVSFFNKPFDGTDIYKAEDMPDIDYLIITHDHWDHLDHQSVTKLRDRITKVICPLGVGEHFERWGFTLEQLVEMDWNEQFQSGELLTITCLSARHFSGRSFTSKKTLWASFMIETLSKRIYISGDGGYDTHFREIGERFPNIDLALMENGQYNKDWRYIHLMPDEQLKAIKDLSPKQLITGHNSKYALAKHAWDEPMNMIRDAAKRDSLPLLMPKIGEIVSLN